MKRRTYLVGSVTAIVGIAGCGSPGTGVNETDGSPTEIGTDVDGESPAATPTEMETDSPTPTEAAEPTPTETETTSATPTGSPTATGTQTGEQSVEMVTEDEDFYFDPIGLAVEEGTTVEWTISSGDHSSTAYEERIPSNADSWDSGILTEDGESFSHTFDVEGTYDYYCTPHQSAGMVARIVVGQPGGPAESSMPPDGEVPESQRIMDEGSVSYDAFTSGES